MGLTLKDAMFFCRTEIGELNQYKWSDLQLIFDLNHSARRMCSKAGFLTKFQNLTLQLNATTGNQEGALDSEVLKVKAAKYFAGQLFPLEPRSWKTLQAGASTGSIPRWYYLKTGTREMTPQSLSTSDIVVQPLPPGSFGQTYRTVLGIWPVVPQPAQIHVWYSYVHDWMQDPTDPCALPDDYLEPWCFGAIARCMRIQRAQAEADKYERLRDAGTEDFRIWASSQQNADQPARYGNFVEPWRQSASSSVIFVDPHPGGI